MLYALIARDKPDSLQLRLDTRPTHVAYLESLNAAGKLKLAGPFLDAEGKPNGSLVVYETDTIEAAQALVDADPYTKAGLFARTELTLWNWTINKPA
jgi:uncharacterized protein YciI